jgi:DNA-binding winged helix-turn-helix (wHTH) protein
MHRLDTGSTVVRFGVFELDVQARELRQRGRRVHLQHKPFDTLTLLLERRGSVVTRDGLRQHLWPADTFVSFDDGLNTTVSKLRQALGDSADSPRFIETIPRYGYRFVGFLLRRRCVDNLAYEARASERFILHNDRRQEWHRCDIGSWGV